MPKRLTTETFIEKALIIHKGFFIYELVEYKNSKIKIEIICPIHGVFKQKPNDHLTGYGCSLCARKIMGNQNQTPTEMAISQFQAVHGTEKYLYHKVAYVNSRTRIIIVCVKHGDFTQTPDNHLQNHGCPKCGREKTDKGRVLTSDLFVKQAREIHGLKYGYDSVVYVNNLTPVILDCPDHGLFSIKPVAHIHEKTGCQMCSPISYGESLIEMALDNLELKYIREATFPTCIYKAKLRFDFQVFTDKSFILIEFDGRQHLGINTIFNDPDISIRDEIKNQWAIDNGIKLIRLDTECYKLSISEMVDLLQSLIA